jgi:hypothetical protein
VRLDELIRDGDVQIYVGKALTTCQVPRSRDQVGQAVEAKAQYRSDQFVWHVWPDKKIVPPRLVSLNCTHGTATHESLSMLDESVKRRTKPRKRFFSLLLRIDSKFARALHRDNFKQCVQAASSLIVTTHPCHLVPFFNRRHRAPCCVT